jgi:pimeloyl-ACP methyl ester carboxylesterase
VICFGKRGSGLSKRDLPFSETPPLGEWVEDLRTVIDEVCSRRVALVGDTEGALIPTLFAATYPERTQALVLVNCFARPHGPHQFVDGDFESFCEFFESA